MKLLYGEKTPTPEYPQFISLDAATVLETTPEESPSRPPTPGNLFVMKSPPLSVNICIAGSPEVLSAVRSMNIPKPFSEPHSRENVLSTLKEIVLPPISQLLKVAPTSTYPLAALDQRQVPQVLNLDNHSERTVWMSYHIFSLQMKTTIC